MTLFEIQSELNEGKAVRIPARYVGHVMDQAAVHLPADVVWDVLVERGAAIITDPRYWGKPVDSDQVEAKMKPESKKDDVGGASPFLAVAPYSPDVYGGMRDADGDRVITCNGECPPCMLYKEKRVDDDAWFICPKCGRLGQRMEEASHRQVLTATAARPDSVGAGDGCDNSTQENGE